MPDIPQFILERACSKAGVFTADEVAQWPAGLLDRLVAADVLRADQPAKSLSCDACGDDHVEIVQYVESPLSTGLRAYIPCPQVGRVFVPAARLRRWSINTSLVVLESEPAGRSEMATSVGDEPLSDRSQSVLVAMLELEAVDSDSRKPTDEIAVKALGEGTDPNALKSVMSELNTRELINSKTGRGGGCWLAEKGYARATKLRNQ